MNACTLEKSGANDLNATMPGNKARDKIIFRGITKKNGTTGMKHQLEKSKIKIYGIQRTRKNRISKKKGLVSE